VLYGRTGTTPHPVREILLPEGTPPQHARPIRSETRATLVVAIARGRCWLDELTTDASITTDHIAEREGCRDGLREAIDFDL
jgi:hypothetical protein